MSTRELASALAGLRYEQLPDKVIEDTKALIIDWWGCALAGKGAFPIKALEGFSEAMGPEGGPCEVLVSRKTSSAWFASLINAAASHVVEQDDLHNHSILHPATVVIPAVLAAAQEKKASGKELLTSIVVGYEVGARVGMYLGRSHYRIFHTTGTAGTLGAAAGVAHLMGLDEQAMVHALGSAGTQAAGLWEFLKDGADSKQLHTAKAAANGYMSAFLAREGFTGATNILEGTQGMAAGMSHNSDVSKLLNGLGTQWAVSNTSMKYHASCRHTHPAADALLTIVTNHDLKPINIRTITAYVYQAALDVLGPVKQPKTVHQSKFCMGFVLGHIAMHQRASVLEFTEASLANAELKDLHNKTTMLLDKEIDAAYPEEWGSRVVVETESGQTLDAYVKVPKGDPENPLTRDELESKAISLADFQGGASEEEMHKVIAMIWQLENLDEIGIMLPNTSKREAT